MALSIITGLTGSGKSHQAVKYFLVPNFAKGRTIRTNIKGLNIDEIIKYCKKHFPKIQEENLGKIIAITDKDITADNFYPILHEIDNKEVMDDSNSIIKNGDVIIIDESAQFFRKKPSDKVLTFFTMHRHFTDEKGLSSEICLLVQSIKLIATDTRNLAKASYYCKKQDLLGFSNKYYLGVFDGSDMNPKHRISNSLQSYDKEIFPLYSSYAKGQGKEQSLDKRINILKSPKFILLGIAMLACPLFLIYTLNSFFNPKPKTAIAESSSPKSAGGTTSSTAQPVQTSTEPTFKIVGLLDTPSKRLVFLQDQNKQIKLVYPQSCNGTGMLLTCKIDNKEIGYYNYLRTGDPKNENKNNMLPDSLPIQSSTSTANSTTNNQAKPPN